MNKDALKYRAFLQSIIEKTGYDFSGYSDESITLKLGNFFSSESIGPANELWDSIDTNKIIQEKHLNSMLANYSEMFRDPGFFISLRSNVLPHLETFDKIHIWHAGCSTGEEAYSLAILLDEHDLLSRCEIFVTDICDANLANGRRGIYPLTHMKESASRYHRSGGRNNLAKYYSTFYDYVIFKKYLCERIKFISQDHFIDERDEKFHLVICKDIFIYFDHSLQQSVLKSFANNLHHDGYLGLGLKEYSVDVSRTNLTIIDEDQKIYRKNSKL